MKKFLLILLLLPIFSKAQYFDDFADGNFKQDPQWMGDTGEYKISVYSSSTWSLKPRLQLNGIAADTSVLYFSAPMSNLKKIQWDFWTRLNFSTSKSNNCRVYLASDNSDLKGSLNGYFIQFGDDNNDALDSITLYRQTGFVTHKVLRSHFANTNSAKSYRIKITKDNSGLWSLYSDTLGYSDFILEGTGTDTTFNSSLYFGVYCKYTSTNKTNFYFDDFRIGPIYIDTIPPVVNAVNVISNNQLDILFSESVDIVSAETLTNYFVNNGIGYPMTAVKDTNSGSLVHLTFFNSFSFGILNEITINGVKDLAGNTETNNVKSFALYTVKQFDILINEIMANPNPPVGLPNYEYLELYNRTSLPISLKYYTLKISTTTKTLPDVTIQPNGYLILCSNAAKPDMVQFGQVEGFDSFSLPNEGTAITLKDPYGRIIHTIAYTTDWYHDATKDDGGWSMEQIDPLNPCGETENWKASVNLAGGTPGKINSVNASNPDTRIPAIKNITPYSNNIILITFNETVDSSLIKDKNKYIVDNGIGNPDSVFLYSPAYKSVRLHFADSFQQNTIYNLSISDTIKDCSGNINIGSSKTFALYDVKFTDIEINEIMANPSPPLGLPECEYLELYNKTSFPISLKKWTVILGTTGKTIQEGNIEPNGYLIICDLGKEYLFNNYGQAIGLSGFTLSNTGEKLMLLDTNRNIISTVTFTDLWYNNPNKAEGGWSLEQIDPLNPCGEAANWTASNDQNGGTPGNINSVNAPNPDNQKPQLIRASANRYTLNQVRLFFNEPLDSSTLKNPLKYIIDNGIGSPSAIKINPPDYKTAVLTLASNLQYGITYYVKVTDSIKDCIGNLIEQNTSVRFAVPQITDTNDLVINELMPNPNPGGVDYVEIYNRSTKVLNLLDLNLASYDTINKFIYQPKSISDVDFLIFPEEYLCLSISSRAVKNQYSTTNPYGFVDMNEFPSYNNDAGIVVISRKDEKLIDFVKYTSDMFFALLNTTDGVSLERINYNRPSGDRTNWHSAAETVGFGTPAYKNSEYSAVIADDGAITLYPDIFSPDNDGYNDVLNINYKFDEPGYTANILIYDEKGRLLRTLTRNLQIGTSGTISWDGTTDGNTKANIGIYIIYFEVFDLKGKTKHYKKTTVLATKF
jgi:hypothetical protein